MIFFFRACVSVKVLCVRILKQPKKIGLCASSDIVWPLTNTTIYINISYPRERWWHVMFTCHSEARTLTYVEDPSIVQVTCDMRVCVRVFQKMMRATTRLFETRGCVKAGLLPHIDFQIRCRFTFALWCRFDHFQGETARHRGVVVTSAAFLMKCPSIWMWLCGARPLSLPFALSRAPPSFNSSYSTSWVNTFTAAVCY